MTHVARSLGPVLLLGLLVAGCGGSSSGGTPTAGPFSGATAAGASSASSAAPASGSQQSAAPQPGSSQGAASSSAPSSATRPALPTVSGWLPYWTYAAADPIVDANTGNGLDEVNTFGMGLQPDGSLLKRRGVEDQSRIDRIRARGGEVIPTIYDVHDRTALEQVVASPALRARAIQSMVALLDQNPAYDGIDIDFEHAKTAFKDAFSRFVAELGREVRARGKVFSVTIPGKRAGSRSWGGYDYAALGAAADRVKIMCYGYSGTWTAAPGGPIAPTDWIEKVLDYATSVIPRAKLQIGIPFYGYDWPSDGSRIRSVTYRRAQTLLQSHPQARVTFVTSRGEAKFTYTEAGVLHTVWFSEERSIAAKASLAKRYGVRGISIWALGYGDRPLWDALRRTLKTP